MSTSLFRASAPLFILSLYSALVVVPVRGYAVFAETSKTVSEQDLAKRLKFYQSISTLTVDFKQLKILKDLHVEIPSEGRLKLKGRDQVIWEVNKPSLVRLTFDHKTIKIESGEGADYSTQTLKTSDIPKGKESKNIAALEAWLQMDAQALSQKYLVTSVGPNTLRFTSKELDKSSFRSVEMNLTSSGHLERLHIVEGSGDEIDIRFGPPNVTYERKLN